MEEMLIALVVKYPLAASVLAVIGGFRIVFKPLMDILMKFVEYTDTPKDNELLQKFMSSWLYGKLVWLIDLTASISLPPKTKKE
jgi:hypothetical protein